jgi:NADPH2:quinone reductase
MARPDRMIAPQLAELFELMESGKIKAVVGGSYPLSEAKRAHEDLRGRKTTGKVFLDPKL